MSEKLECPCFVFEYHCNLLSIYKMNINGVTTLKIEAVVHGSIVVEFTTTYAIGSYHH